MNLWKYSNYSTVWVLYSDTEQSHLTTRHSTAVFSTQRWQLIASQRMVTIRIVNKTWAAASICEFSRQGLVVAAQTTLPVEKPQTQDPLRKKNAAAPSKLTPHTSLYCKTMFHLRFERWVSQRVFPLKASLLAFCRAFSNADLLDTNVFWNEQTFDLMWVGGTMIWFHS